jgi:predicted metalloendopeptidase
MTKPQSLLVALAVTAAVAAASAQSRTPPRVPGIDTAGMDLTVRPQDDFFRYVNGSWADKTPIPPDQSVYGTFAMLRDRAQEAVRGIVEAEAIKPAAPGSMGQKVGGFYKSFMDEARVESLGVRPLEAELAAI